jgi:hypothetical protein
MAESSFALPDGSPAPVRFNHLAFKRSLGKVVDTLCLDDGTTFVAVEMNTDDPRVRALFEAAGDQELWCFSLGHTLYTRENGMPSYAVKDITITGLGGRDYTVAFNSESIKRLMETAAALGIDGSEESSTVSEPSESVQETDTTVDLDTTQQHSSNDTHIVNNEYGDNDKLHYTPNIPVEKVQEITIQASRHLFAFGKFNVSFFLFFFLLLQIYLPSEPSRFLSCICLLLNITDQTGSNFGCFKEIPVNMSASTNQGQAQSTQNAGVQPGAKQAGANGNAGNTNNVNNNNGVSSSSSGGQKTAAKSGFVQPKIAGNNGARNGANNNANMGNQAMGMPNMFPPNQPFMPPAPPFGYGYPYMPGYPPFYYPNQQAAGMQSMHPAGMTGAVDPNAAAAASGANQAMPPNNSSGAGDDGLMAGLDPSKPDDAAIINILQQVNKSKTLTDRLSMLLGNAPTKDGDATVAGESAAGESQDGNDSAASNDAKQGQDPSSEFLGDLKVCFERELQNESISKEQYDEWMDYIENHLSKNPQEFSRVIKFLAANNPGLNRGEAEQGDQTGQAEDTGMTGNNWYPGYGYGYGAQVDVSANSSGYNQAPAAPHNPYAVPFDPLGPVPILNQSEMTDQVMQTIQQRMFAKNQGNGFVKVDPNQPNRGNGTIPLSLAFASSHMYDPLKIITPDQLRQQQDQQQQQLQLFQQFQRWQQEQQRGKQAPQGQLAGQPPRNNNPMNPNFNPNFGGPAPNGNFGMTQFPGYPGMPGYPMNPGMFPQNPYSQYPNQSMPNQAAPGNNNNGQQPRVHFYIGDDGKMRRSDNHRFVSEKDLAQSTTAAQSRRFDSAVTKGLNGAKSGVAPVEKRNKGEMGSSSTSGQFDPTQPLPLLTNVYASSSLIKQSEDPNLVQTVHFFDRELQRYFRESPEAKKIQEERFGPNPSAAYVHQSMKKTSELQAAMFDRIVNNLTNPNRAGWYERQMTSTLNLQDPTELYGGKRQVFADSFIAPQKGQTIAVNASSSLFGKTTHAWVQHQPQRGSY